MSNAVQELLNSFGQLSHREQADFAKEICKQLRSPQVQEDLDWSFPEDEELTYLAAQLFEQLDREEARDGKR